MKSYLSGKKIDPEPIRSDTTLSDLVNHCFDAYNAARLREGCQLFVRKMLAPEVTVGMSLTGALTPAGLGVSCLIPLVNSGFVDWIVSTGANLYHDAHFGIGLPLFRGSPQVEDVALKEEGVVRIFDVFFDYEVLLSTDSFFRTALSAPEFQGRMSSAEFHHRIGRYLAERENLLGRQDKSLLAACFRHKVPIFTSSPGDSSIGMNLAASQLEGSDLVLDSSLDVNETAAIVLSAKRAGGRSATLIIGGGSPKNFLLQTEPQLQEVLGIREKGHDYFLQFTDARPDTGGLSGATPGEAVTWGKVDPESLPDAVVCYADATISLPILTAYALANHAPRSQKELQARLPELVKALREEYGRAKRQ